MRTCDPADPARELSSLRRMFAEHEGYIVSEMRDDGYLPDPSDESTLEDFAWCLGVLSGVLG
jgi:hypothetical protein